MSKLSRDFEFQILKIIGNYAGSVSIYGLNRTFNLYIHITRRRYIGRIYVEEQGENDKRWWLSQQMWVPRTDNHILRALHSIKDVERSLLQQSFVNTAHLGKQCRLLEIELNNDYTLDV